MTITQFIDGQILYAGQLNVMVDQLNAGGIPNQQLTGFFFANNGAQIDRLADRLFVGSATVNDGKNPNVTKDWLSQIVEWPVYLATSAITSPVGQIALTLGSRTSNLSAIIGTSQITIGAASFVINDNTSTNYDAYAYYGEARSYPSVSGISFGMELDAINFNTQPTNTSSPYHQLFSGSTVGVWMASGGGLAGVNDSQAAFAVANNGAKFMTGLSFGAESIFGTDGVSGFGEAIALAKGHVIRWYAAGGAFGNGLEVASITSTATDPAHKMSLQFQDGGALFVGPSDTALFAVAPIANAVNGIGSTGAVTLNPPFISAFGSDTNVDLGLRTQGTGIVRPYASIRADASVGNVLVLRDTQNIVYTNAGGNQTAAILSSTANGSNFASLNFADGGPFFFSTAGGTILGLSIVANAVNYLSIIPGISGTAPQLQVQGVAADVNLSLYPKGGGQIQTNAPVQSSAVAGGGGAVPATVETYMKMTINGTVYAIPLFRIS